MDRIPRDRKRSRSPDRDHHRSHHRERSSHRHHGHSAKGQLLALPYGSRQLSKHDFKAFRPMFAMYLHIQKGKFLDDLDDTEAKGRWKSFIGKWNRRELAEGWYDPSTLEKAISTSQAEQGPTSRDDQLGSRTISSPNGNHRQSFQDESDVEIGPTLPGRSSGARKSKSGSMVPNTQDLELKREMDEEDASAARDDLRFSRKLDRKAQKEALDELVPRADAGTRERQLEKKREVNEKMKSFREKSPGTEEVPENDLMGGGDSVADFKRQKQEFERKKNERELRREEFLRARAAEREERMGEYRQKEEKTMELLKALAKQNFG